MKTISSTPKTFIFDMDGVICEECPTFERSMAKPIINTIEIMKELYLRGNAIIIFTARSWSEYNMTWHWLDRHGVFFNQLICGKPVGDYWIDDRALEFSTWQNTIRTMITEE